MGQYDYELINVDMSFPVKVSYNLQASLFLGNLFPRTSNVQPFAVWRVLDLNENFTHHGLPWFETGFEGSGSTSGGLWCWKQSNKLKATLKIEKSKFVPGEKIPVIIEVIIIIHFGYL